jgi:four helix bundle protein
MGLRVQRFEDLQVWQRSMDLAVAVYAVTRNGAVARDFAFSDQLHRAATSVPSNIAEGFDRGSRAEFHRFLSIAKGSCAELRTRLQLALRVGYLQEQPVAEMLQTTDEVSRMIGRLRATVANHRDLRTKPTG